MKKSFLISVINGVLLVLMPLLFSSVLAALYLLCDNIHTPDTSALMNTLVNTPLLGILIWLVWLTGMILTIRYASGGAALGIAGLLFCSCGFYGLSFAASYEIFSFPAGIRALFTLFGAPYTVLSGGMRQILPEEGVAAMAACTAYLLLVIAAAGYAAVRLGRKDRRRK